MKKHVFVVLMALLIAFSALFTLGTGQAHAAGVGPYTHKALTAATYDPNDPHDSGCWNSGAYVANVAYVMDGSTRLATVENWYSPSCIKNWGQIEWTSGTALSLNVGAYIKSNPSIYQCFPTNCAFGGYNGGLSPAWTDMVDGHSAVRVYGDVVYKGNGYSAYADA